MGNFWIELHLVAVTVDGSLRVPCPESSSDVTGLAVGPSIPSTWLSYTMILLHTQEYQTQI